MGIFIASGSYKALWVWTDLFEHVREPPVNRRSSVEIFFKYCGFRLKNLEWSLYILADL